MIPLRFSLALLASAATLLKPVVAETLNYDFNITWLRANPDGAYERPVIGINGQWPIPPIFANVGDNLVVRVTNQLGNDSTSLHFHGLYMNGTNHMDGPAQVTQCPIQPGSSFTYNFTVGCLHAFFQSPATRATNADTYLSPDQPAGDVLVPLAYPWTVPGWVARSCDRPRPGVSVHQAVR